MPVPSVAGNPDLDRSRRAFCAEVTPEWRFDAEGALLDLTGLERHHGPGAQAAEALCHQASRRFPFWSAGWGASPLVSRLASDRAAAWGEGALLTVPLGNGAAFLSGFPLGVLPRDEGVLERLHLLGVKTLGDLQTVPLELLVAVFGEDGRLLHRDAFAGDPLPALDPGAPSRRTLVARARFRRPLDSPAAVAALQRGLAVRALAWSAGLPRVRYRWLIEASWAGGSRRQASRRHPFPERLADWRALLAALWKSFAGRRTGLLETALYLAGGADGDTEQPGLFLEDPAGHRLARAVEKIRRDLDPAFRPASEALLDGWGVSWESPRRGTPGRGQAG